MSRIESGVGEERCRVAHREWRGCIPGIGSSVRSAASGFLSSSSPACPSTASHLAAGFPCRSSSAPAPQQGAVGDAGGADVHH